MNGLIFRELYLSKKNYIISGFSLLIAVILEVMVRLSLNFGNLSKLEADSFNSTDKVTFYVFIFGISVLTYFVFFSDDSGVILSDVKCKWSTFACTFPVSEVRLVWTKYVIKLCALVLGFIVSILNAFLVCGLSGRTLDGLTVKILCGILVLAAMITFIHTPLMLKFKSAGIVSGIFMGLFALVYFGVAGRLVAFLEEHNAFEDDNEAANALINWLKDIGNTVKPYIIPACVLLVSVTFSAGFGISVRLLKRREKQ